ncbi:hypothetical protein A1OE_577 [Candidatus Endolissoclinum faulkneri L2]|uniref:Uncharacterized protein n=1 Tax=Candidatus Endolissoclinum faulkneri L2 TaxID=1193729 RepID=K7Z428_9PROT|nr:hypothetical protein A1OE_577 [Candidatus Endolissoclinum faulkneri L2]
MLITNHCFNCTINIIVNNKLFSIFDNIVCVPQIKSLA